MDLTNADYGEVALAQGGPPTEMGIQPTREVTDEYALTLRVPSKPAVRKPTSSMTREVVLCRPDEQACRGDYRRENYVGDKPLKP